MPSTTDTPLNADELLNQITQFANNKSKRIMICFCIDCSASMMRQQAMNKVNDGLKAFLQKTSNDVLAHDAADICVVSFGDQARLVSDFDTPDAVLHRLCTNPILPDGAGTVLAAGVNMTLDHLARRKARLAAVNNNAYVPWLIIISDGDSTEPPAVISRAVERVKKKLEAHELKTMCLNMGSGSNTLPRFTIDGNVGRLDTLRVTDFFDMLSRNVSQTSRAAVECGGPELERAWI